MDINDENFQSTNQIRKKVLVVGATGFLGSKIVRSLALEKNLVVRAMSRRDTPAGAAAGSGRQGCESRRVKVPLPSVAQNGRLAYPLLGEVTDRDRRGRKSHGRPVY